MTEDGPQGARRRTHPITPVLQVVRTVPVLVLAIIAFGLDSGAPDELAGADFPAVGGVLLIAAGVLVLGLVVLGFSYLGWRRLEFWFDEAGDFRLDSGVLSRTERRLALSRLQSVDVVQPLVARLFGFAALTIEVAGAGDSRARLQYLSEQDARRLREEVLARAAGLRPDVGQAPERVLTTVPPGVLAHSLLRSSAAVWGVLLTGAVITLAALSEGFVGLLALLLTGGLPALAVIGEFVRHFGFTLAESPDGLRIRSGLTSTVSLTVPPGRVHAVQLTQPFLWRSKGWVRVELTLAGTSGSDQEQGFAGVLLPVAPRSMAMGVVGRILPGLDLEAMDWAPAPERARWRAPIQWRQLAVAKDAVVFAARRGRFVRRTAVMPQARTQSIHLTQGPWQRRLGLASLRIDIAPGPVAVLGLHQPVESVRALVDQQAQLARQSRLEASPQRWLLPTASTDIDEQPAEAPPAERVHEIDGQSSPPAG